MVLGGSCVNDCASLLIASSNVYKAGIGLVQKVPRMLGYLGNVGAEGKGQSDVERFNSEKPNLKFTNPKNIIFV